MKVTHIIDSGGYYGAEVMLVHLCQAQQKAGLQVEVISIGTHGNYKKPLEEKLEEYGILYLPWRMLALPNPRESFKILKHCQQQGTDIIHSHGYKGNILLGLIPKCWRKIPVVTTVHGYTRHSGFSKMAINQWLDRLCLPKMDAVVLVSKGMMHQIPEHTIGKKLFVIANGIQKEAPSDAASPVPEFSDKHFNIAAIGRLSTEKNFKFLITNMPEILNIIPSARLFIYGEGEERESLSNLISSLKMESHVFLPGYSNNPGQIYKHANLFINCSITEGMPITILEAIREGCPILVSRIEANTKLLENAKVENIFFDLNNADLIDSIKSIDQYETKKLKKYFMENFTSEKMAANYQSLYTALANNIIFEKN